MEMSIHFPNLGIHLNNVGKSVEVMGFSISFYGILLAAAMLLAMFYVVMLAKRSNQNQDLYLELMLVTGIAAVFGARIFYMAFNGDLQGAESLKFLISGRGAFPITELLLAAFWQRLFSAESENALSGKWQILSAWVLW